MPAELEGYFCGIQYYVQSTCCNTIYALDPEIGRQIAKGKFVHQFTPFIVSINKEPRYNVWMGLSVNTDF